MRRPGSSSCLLLPKETLTDGDAPEPLSAASSSNSPLSVTLISKETLDSFSSERFFLLAEIEINAQGNIFLCDLDGSNRDDATQGTEETEEDRSVSPAEEVPNIDSSPRIETDATPQPPPQFPSYVLLYILWRPDMPDDPEIFTEGYILPAVRSLQDHVEIVSSVKATGLLKLPERPRTFRFGVRGSSSASNVRPPPPPPPPSEPRSDSKSEHESNTDALQHTPSSAESPSRTKSSVYILVDRVMPAQSGASGGDDGGHSAQEDLGEKLARAVSVNPVLRRCSEGITVGISNHVRAAPALEACVHSINLGAQDRRRFAAANNETGDGTSLLGIVASTPQDMLGLQDATITDAAQGVLQSKVTAEWNGYGNLQTFAARAHSKWKAQRGIPETNSAPTKRKMPRRIRRNRRGRVLSAVQQAALERAMREQFYDALAVSLIAGYILFHFGDECRWMFQTGKAVLEKLLNTLQLQ